MEELWDCEGLVVGVTVGMAGAIYRGLRRVRCRQVTMPLGVCWLASHYWVSWAEGGVRWMEVWWSCLPVNYVGPTRLLRKLKLGMWVKV